jgi:gliding motility-associated-like protein
MKKLIFLLIILNFSFVFSQENCANGIDDDNDGLIDLNDPDCICQVQVNEDPVSLIPNPSFEEFSTCCPSFYSELYCSDGWIQASDATSDYLNTCDFVMNNILVGTNFIPFPDGQGIAGFIVMNGYIEYIGACLLSPMLAGESYTVQFQLGSFLMNSEATAIIPNSNLSDLEISIFGASSCGNIPFAGFGCPPNNTFSIIGTTIVQFNTDYQVVSITFTPTIDINEIIIGSSCNIPPDYPVSLETSVIPYFLIDNIVVNETINFGSNLIMKTGKLCTNDLKLYANPSEPGGTFQWYEDGIALVGQTNDTLFVSQLGLNEGTYQLIYTLNNECYMTSIIIDPFVPFSVQANNENVCLGGTVQLTATGANSYTWNPNTYLNTNTGSTVESTPIENINYTITGSDIEGCLNSTTINVIVEPLIIIVNNATACFEGEEVVLQASGAQNYTWDPPTGLSSTIGSEVIATVNSSISYTIIGEENGCFGQAQSNIIYQPELDFSVFFNPNPATVFSPTVIMSAFSFENLNYQWNFNQQVFLDTNNFQYTFPQLDSIYPVLVIATNEKGCIDSLWTSIRILLPSEFYIPNSFSPNGDEHNNIFNPIYFSDFQPNDYNLTIYNRWGEKIFSSNDLNIGWDGTYLGVIVQQGTYTYQVTYTKEINSEKIVLNGHVIILK